MFIVHEPEILQAPLGAICQITFRSSGAWFGILFIFYKYFAPRALLVTSFDTCD
jgi:hypothetical protein